jgi:threonine/homoserine/homoserine lactone efflux protein
MVLGDFVWFSFATLGLAAVAQLRHGLLVVVKYAGVAYLLLLAWKLWKAPAAEPFLDEERQGVAGTKLVFAGLSLTLGNPKAMVFFLAILPHVLDLGALDAAAFIELAAGIMTIFAMAMWGYALLAQETRRLVRDGRKMRAIIEALPW